MLFSLEIDVSTPEKEQALLAFAAGQESVRDACSFVALEAACLTTERLNDAGIPCRLVSSQRVPVPSGRDDDDGA